MRVTLRLLSVFCLLSAAAVLPPSSVYAQQNTALPELPDPIQNLVEEGAQIRYLGRDHNLDSWITVKNGKEQYFYVLPDKSAFVMGVLFDKDGQAVTVDQVRRLREKGDSLLDSLASNDFNDVAGLPKSQKETAKFKSPAEQLYNDIENSNWVPLGQMGAPVLYSFIDPQCPHCHSFIQDLQKDYIEKGRVQVRIVPVGFRDETRAQAAYLIATPNPQERWFNHMNGDESALPAKSGINQQGVQRNLAIMQSWKFNVTPMIIYRGKDETVKIIQGRPKDIPGVIEDIGVRG